MLGSLEEGRVKFHYGSKYSDTSLAAWGKEAVLLLVKVTAHGYIDFLQFMTISYSTQVH